MTRRVIRGRGGAWWTQRETEASLAKDHAAGPRPNYADLRAAADGFATDLEAEAARLDRDAQRFDTRGYRQLAGELRGLQVRILALAATARAVRDVE